MQTENDIRDVVIYAKDRFVRFGFDWFEKSCEKFKTEIMIVNNETLSPNEELVQDIISILHVFSCRLYGLRKCKKQIYLWIKEVRSKSVKQSIMNADKALRKFFKKESGFPRFKRKENLI